MLDIILALGGFIIILILFELLDLPDLIGKKIRGETSKNNLEQELEEVKKRLKKLEDVIYEKNIDSE